MEFNYLATYSYNDGKASGFGSVPVCLDKVTISGIRRIEDELNTRNGGGSGTVVLNLIPLEQGD